MNEFIEKLIGRLEEERAKMEDKRLGYEYESPWKDCCSKVKEIVNQLAEEYKDGWIPCSERLPEETECYFVTWRDRATCKNYVEITEYDAGSQEWLDCICQAGLLGYDIIAWKPLPAPYQPKGE